jgi:hypothetical protein
VRCVADRPLDDADRATQDDERRRGVSASAAPSTAPPATPWPLDSDDAIKLAIKLAVDAGEYERAAALLDVARRTTKPGSVTLIDSARATGSG